MKVIWSPLALDKSSAADKWVNDIFDCAELIGTQPKMGREVPELLGSNYREVIFGSYRIIYKIETAVKILTLRNCRQLLTADDIELRDEPKLFGQSPNK